MWPGKGGSANVRPGPFPEFGARPGIPRRHPMTHCTRRGPAYWRRKIITGTLGAVLTGGAAAALASDYPDQPIRIVVPWPAGGLVDLPARLLAEKLQAELGTTVIVENKTGDGGTIGAAMENGRA